MFKGRLQSYLVLSLVLALLVNSTGYAHVGCLKLHEQETAAIEAMPPCHQEAMGENNAQSKDIDCCDNACRICLTLQAITQEPLLTAKPVVPQKASFTLTGFIYFAPTNGLDRPPKILT